ncbi:hypothetical protein N9L36_02040 [Schleiferiaceae bacterium]|nr:hypothetical protein [Schleiferiaceae bacterium]
MKLLTTILVVLISISAFSQEKLIYHGDGIITQGLDTLSLEEFKGMCLEKRIVKYQRVNRSPSFFPFFRREIVMTFDKAVKKSFVGQTKRETTKYNLQKIAFGLPSTWLGAGLLFLNLVDYADGEGDWVRPAIGVSLELAGLMMLNDVSARSNHKYQSDVYFEMLVSRYNNK